MVTINGSNFKLTVKYPNSPWQQIKNNKNKAIYFIWDGSLFFNENVTNKIEIRPRVAAKYLWITSGITLLISYGKLGYLCSAKAISTSEVGKTTNP